MNGKVHRNNVINVMREKDTTREIQPLQDKFSLKSDMPHDRQMAHINMSSFKFQTVNPKLQATLQQLKDAVKLLTVI